MKLATYEKLGVKYTIRIEEFNDGKEGMKVILMAVPDLDTCLDMTGHYQSIVMPAEEVQTARQVKEAIDALTFRIGNFNDPRMTKCLEACQEYVRGGQKV